MAGRREQLDFNIPAGTSFRTLAPWKTPGVSPASLTERALAAEVANQDRGYGRRAERKPDRFPERDRGVAEAEGIDLALWDGEPA